MPIVRRGSLYLVPRRGMGQSTLATGAALPPFCASLAPQDVAAYPACAALAPSVIAAAQAQTATGQANAAVAQNPPPVYTSSFVPSADPTQWLATSYGVQNTAASLVNQINRTNANLYANYQNAVTDALMTNSPLPAPPSYQSFSSVWPSSLGPVPSTVGSAPAGTPMPVYPTDTQNPISSGFAPSMPVALPVGTSVQSNAPGAAAVPAPAAVVQSNAPTPTAVAPSSGLLQTLQNMVSGNSAAPSSSAPTGDWFGSIPNWVVLAAAGGLGVLLFWPKGRG